MHPGTVRAAATASGDGGCFASLSDGEAAMAGLLDEVGRIRHPFQLCCGGGPALFNRVLLLLCKGQGTRGWFGKWKMVGVGASWVC